MKFAKVFQQVLTDEHLPDDWIDNAIQYKLLKKRINKVVDELESIGLSKNDMKLTYYIEEVNSEIHPELKINISPLTKNLIIDKLDSLGYHYEINRLKIKEISNESELEHDVSGINEHSDVVSNCSSVLNPFDTEPYYELTLSLFEDTKFFQILYNEIQQLNSFNSNIEVEITKKVETIADSLSKVALPNIKNSDMYIWREIFQMYIESEIFFSTVEKNPGFLDIALSKERYKKFLTQLNDSNVLKKFKQKNSINIFLNFKSLNQLILKVSNFQSMNNLAITKILKKFDKQTNLNLNSKKLFTTLIINSTPSSSPNETFNILNGSIAKDVCYIISQNLLNIIPQIDDYLCPICCSVAFKPIKLSCGHIFCVRCLVKLQRKADDRCPLCRHNCLMHTTSLNLDLETMDYMKLYFPKEVKEKQSETEREIFKEQYGHIIDPDAKACTIM